MGYATEGHLRFTLHADATESDIDYLTQSISEVITELRR